MRARRRLWGAAVALLFATAAARGEEASALYQAYWAGLPAGEIRLSLRDDGPQYRDEIEIRSEGLAWMLTRFRARASSEGHLAADPLPTPVHYDAIYDLRKAKDKRLAMRFASFAGAVLAQRGPEDTSSKPQLAEEFRRNVLDPLSALTAIRHALRQGNRGSFTVPVYDGARRFNVLVRVRGQRGDNPKLLELELNLAPMAGFKGESSDDGDPENAPRPLTLTLTDDARLMPVSMRVSVAFMPLVVELGRWCTDGARCGP